MNKTSAPRSTIFYFKRCFAPACANAPLRFRYYGGGLFVGIVLLSLRSALNVSLIHLAGGARSKEGTADKNPRRIIG